MSVDVTGMRWLRVETKAACYAVAFIGTRIVDGADYGMAIVRRDKRLRDVRQFRSYVERGGAYTHVVYPADESLKHTEGQV